MINVQRVLFVLFLLFVTSSFAQSQVLYGAATGTDSGNRPSSLYMINPANGGATLIGPIGFNGVTGLEILPDGRLIASANADDGENAIAVLIEINKTTGAGTLIGVLGNNANEGECGRMPDISYDDNTGTLFGYSDFCGGGDELMEVEAKFINYEGLYIINPNNADVNFVGPSGFEDGGNGMAVRPSDGTIFHVPNDANGGLVILNRNTGQGTIIPGSEGNVPLKIGALDFNPQTGVLYGALKPEVRRGVGLADLELNETEFDSLVIINQTNGVTSILGSSVPGLDAIVFSANDKFVSPVPTLSEYGLIATAILLLAGSVLVLRRRQKLSI
ncbi:MAG: hypothetical protein DHS20C13_19920 [Thermodesulfobacteriota bacterium]|nr:MAG: hypothetical protein DHS20C13_19920 [Thermodesulfobacteriota bacterium]